MFNFALPVNGECVCVCVQIVPAEALLSLGEHFVRLDLIVVPHIFVIVPV